MLLFTLFQFEPIIGCYILFNALTWSMTLALKMASSMCFSSDLMTHLMLLTTCWTSGGRLQLECSRNLATSILVSLYIFRSARECGRSWDECVCSERVLRWMSTFLSSFCCFLLTHMWLGLAPTASAEMSLGSEDKTERNSQNTELIKSHTLRADARGVWELVKVNSQFSCHWCRRIHFHYQLAQLKLAGDSFSIWKSVYQIIYVSKMSAS